MRQIEDEQQERRRDRGSCIAETAHDDAYVILASRGEVCTVSLGRWCACEL